MKLTNLIRAVCCTACLFAATTVAVGQGCPLDCPLDGFFEPEPCGDDTNGGCNSDPNMFTDAACGQTWCGTAWSDGGTRDTDWYLIQHGGGVISATVVSQFSSVCFIVDGIAGCMPIVAGDTGSGNDCANLVVASADLPAGTYVVFVAPDTFEGNPCGSGNNDYFVTIECTPVGGPCGAGAGDCCADNGTPGCDDPACCDLVCSIDPFCCDVFWDSLCANMAADLCFPLCEIGGPANNDCLNADPIENGSTNYSNVDATDDGPSPCGILGSDIWYDYNSTFTGDLEINTCGSGYDTAIAVYDGCACPADIGNLLACNDDFCGLQSSVTVSVVAGGCYKIQVGGFAGSQGDGVINITKLAPPVDCPLSTFGDICELNQSADTETMGFSVGCAGAGTTDQGWARCFDLTAEGATDPVTIDSMTFGVEQASADGININVNLYLDVDGCAAGPNEPGIDAMLVASEPVVVGTADVGTFITVSFTTPVTVGPGDFLWAEIEQVDDGNGANPPFTFLPGANLSDQCGASYIRAEQCGILAWTNMADIGFPDTNWIIVLNCSAESGLEAALDIKPGSCPNPVNTGSNGVIPVALLGSDTFDVMQVDLRTMTISRADGVGGSVGPHEGPPGPHTTLDDVGTPFDGELCDCHELEGDGILDVNMKFKTQAVVDALQLKDLANGTFVELCVTGVLLDGTEFTACDCIRINNPQGGGAANAVAVDSNLPGAWIGVSIMDDYVDGGGFTDGGFTRYYSSPAVLRLTHEPSHEGLLFGGWIVNGDIMPSSWKGKLTVDGQVDVMALWTTPHDQPVLPKKKGKGGGIGDQ